VVAAPVLASISLASSFGADLSLKFGVHEASHALAVRPGAVADVSELKFDKKKDGIEIRFYNGPEDLMNFKIDIEPQNGIYKDGKFSFDVKVPKTYPHDPPKVMCETTVYHPNIDMEGHVCLNILREDWKPVLNMQSVVFGLQYIMLEPNADDPLNKDVSAAELPPHGTCMTRHMIIVQADPPCSLPVSTLILLRPLTSSTPISRGSRKQFDTHSPADQK